MEEKKFDSLIQETLEEQADHVSMSPGMQRQIKQRIRDTEKEEKFMKHHFSKKRLVLAAAAMCIVMSMVAVAGGKVTAWVSGSSPSKPDIASYTDIGRADAYMGFKVQHVEAFANGFQFDKGFLTGVKELDDSNQVIGTFPETNIYYNQGNKRVSMSVIPLGKDSGDAKHAETTVVTYKDVTITCNKDYYKFVPVDYEVTPEEQAAMDAGELYISYGTDKVETSELYFVSWDKEGHYLLMSDDAGVGRDVLLQMAKEVIDAE